MERLNNGQSLSAAMRKYPKIFPEIYVNIVSVGEQSGTLSETMMGLADNLEENDRFKAKVKGALIYPKIIMTVMFTFMIVLAVFVMPRILTIFDSLGPKFLSPLKSSLRSPILSTNTSPCSWWAGWWEV
ncbi:type II secretion system F family protein [Candidatus Peregrinibacteria bacterium]|nr:MAG: type II secretion system F family protein [Candidatus Peregrinibacteria bacterium]